MLSKSHLLHLLKNYINTHSSDWLSTARSSQLPPEGGDWRTWLIMAGRGFGKTRTGAETIKMWAERKLYKRIALIGQSLHETRHIMVEGESGLLSIAQGPKRPVFEPSKRKITWANGAVATLFGADHYDQLRGPQFDAAWIDELAKFHYPEEVWQQLQLALRLGNCPRCIITTTPRPIPLLKKLQLDPMTVTTKGSSFDNKDNLSPRYLEQILKQFEGTRLGAQEIYAQILDELSGALWTREMIVHKSAPLNADGSLKLARIVIAIDPATTHHEGSDETGIILAGVDHEGIGHILSDMSGKHSPTDWGRRVVEAYYQYKADRVVAEVNKGGDLVERVLKSIEPSLSYKAVRATRGKITRAEPIASLYEQKKVIHAQVFHKLETQMCSYTQGSSKSPDRLDALVWALTDLFLEAESRPEIKIWGV